MSICHRDREVGFRPDRVVFTHHHDHRTAISSTSCETTCRRSLYPSVKDKQQHVKTIQQTSSSFGEGLAGQRHKDHSCEVKTKLGCRRNSWIFCANYRTPVAATRGLTRQGIGKTVTTLAKSSGNQYRPASLAVALREELSEFFGDGKPASRGRDHWPNPFAEGWIQGRSRPLQGLGFLLRSEHMFAP
jgi:hypothetical protein